MQQSQIERYIQGWHLLARYQRLEDLYTCFWIFLSSCPTTMFSSATYWLLLLLLYSYHHYHHLHRWKQNEQASAIHHSYPYTVLHPLLVLRLVPGLFYYVCPLLVVASFVKRRKYSQLHAWRSTDESHPFYHHEGFEIARSLSLVVEFVSSLPFLIPPPFHLTIVVVEHSPMSHILSDQKLMVEPPNWNIVLPSRSYIPVPISSIVVTTTTHRQMTFFWLTQMMDDVNVELTLIALQPNGRCKIQARVEKKLLVAGNPLRHYIPL
mmetsp:Transcript_33758/g.34245  ORF Transcript_33758/g.34245 Transcript_33758/m.34245 type:complete len:265 (-) Transcript_33758:150-944(-)